LPSSPPTSPCCPKAARVSVSSACPDEKLAVEAPEPTRDLADAVTVPRELLPHSNAFSRESEPRRSHREAPSV
jgi:hypothetical protein